MFINLMEIFDIALMTFVIGYLFSSMFTKLRHTQTAYPVYKAGFDWEGLKFAALATAPGVVFHELGHKFFGMAFGLHPIIHAAYFWLGFGVIMRLVGFPFLFFVPGYADLCPGTAEAAIACSAFLDANPLASALIAFGGPFVNLVLWIGASYALKQKWMKKKYLPVVFVTKEINKFLFIFNMIPLWFFDGATVLDGLVKFVMSMF